MDNSGNNRFGLLFEDDDISDPLDTIVRKKVKQQPVVGTAVPPTGPAKGPKVDLKAKKSQNAALTAEKENKSAAMNKISKVGGANATGNAVPAKRLNGQANGQVREQRQPREARTGNGNNFNNNNNNNRSQQNGEVRFNRRNNYNRDGQGQQNGTGAPGENDQRPQRQNRGPPRNRNEFGRGKREFDRQSGSDKTGVKSIDKRDGAGAHNWGSVKQDIADVNKSTDEAGLTDKEESGNDQSASEQKDGQQTSLPVEEETKELTLDEWKAQQLQKRAKPQYNIRKAGEGEDVTQWKKMIALNNKKTGANSNESDEELEYDPSMYPQRVGRLQRVLDIQFNFNDNRRGGGPGGQNGRFRGGPGGQRPRNNGDRAPRNQDGGNVDGQEHGGQQGGNRRERGDGAQRQGGQRQRRGDGERQRGGHGQEQHAPKVDDVRQFPTLS